MGPGPFLEDLRMTMPASPFGQHNDMDERLVEHQRIWAEKPTLRTIYMDYHRRLEAS